MNHPKPEEWVPYLYGEATSTARQALAAHLQECRQCREEIETWKRNLHRLDAWKVPKVRRSPELLLPFLKLAAAAAIVLVAGISIGRATAPKVDIEKLRLAITPGIRRDLSQEMTQLVREEAARTAAITLTSGRRYTDQTAQQIYILLKKDVDTLAVNADAQLRHTAQQLFQLADYEEPTNPAGPNR